MRFFGIAPKSFGQLGVYEKQVCARSTDNVVIKAGFLRPYCVAYLDQLVRQYRNHTPLTLASSYSAVNRYLQQSGFEFMPPVCELGDPFPEEKIVPIQRFSGGLDAVESEVVGWLDTVVKPLLPAHTTQLWKKINANYWEIIQNGIVHGNCVHGVSTCGQVYPEKGYMELAFHDIGYGIPGRVKDYFNNADEIRDDHKCIAWAVEMGNSTRPAGESAGLGLHFLREFLRLNKGVFQVISGNGYFGECEGNPAETTTLKNSVRGTLVNIRIILDDCLYKLKDEKI